MILTTSKGLTFLYARIPIVTTDKWCCLDLQNCKLRIYYECSRSLNCNEEIMTNSSWIFLYSIKSFSDFRNSNSNYDTARHNNVVTDRRVFWGWKLSCPYTETREMRRLIATTWQISDQNSKLSNNSALNFSSKKYPAFLFLDF